MANRYRIVLDVCEDETKSGEYLGSSNLIEIQDSAASAAKMAIPQALRRSVRIHAVQQRNSCWHTHDGTDCVGCLRMANDGLNGEDLTMVFPPPVSL